MKEDFLQLSPSLLWGYFYDLTQIPRPSGFMAPIQKYMTDFGLSLGLSTVKDEAGNILIKKPATPGKEHCPSVVLQAHLDMVPQKNSQVVHDFEKDPLTLRIENGWVKAVDTTLGSDNGIGVAAIMAVLSSTDLQHGPVEALFTVDEETGMFGAFGLKPNAFDSKILLNLDSEDEGDLFVGCAGGVNLTAEFEYEKNVSVPEGDIAVKLNLSGLKGGHSGVDILLGRANANKLLFRFLKKAVAEYEARLASFSGGTLRNAIPREAFAILTLPEDGFADFAEAVAAYEDQLNLEYKGIENQLHFTLDQVEIPAGILPEDVQDDVINAIVAVHDGVLRRIPDMPDVVETSSNLAICESKEGLISCQILVRSAAESMKSYLYSMLQSCFSMAGAKVTESGDYPGWMPNLQSPIKDLISGIYENEFGKKPNVNVIHAGLECGIIQDAVGTLDMISFGPTIAFPHSPDEKVNIASVERFWHFLVRILSAV